MASVDELAQVIWDHHQLNHELAPSYCLLVLGSHDLQVAGRGADLYLEGLAPLIVFSGGLGRLTSRLWREPEAVQFARLARQRGVPDSDILVEPDSTNTGENIRFSRRALEGSGQDPQTFILVQKPYMERRAWAATASLPGRRPVRSQVEPDWSGAVPPTR